ncbi:MAG: low temperature requirement protein A [Sphaerochaetaceae bacterium]
MRLRDSIRYWWSEPRSANNRDENRKVTYLELFNDLVYSVFFARLTQSYVNNSTYKYAFLAYLIKFILSWIVWFNAASYYDLHGNDDIRGRLFTFFQMFLVASLALFGFNALTKNYVGFGFSYSILMLFQAFLWYRTGKVHDNHAKYSKPYSILMSILAIFFLSSIIVGEQLRLIIWGVTCLGQVVVILYISYKNWRLTGEGEMFLRITNSFQARVSRLVLIVLGQMVTQIISGVYFDDQILYQNFKKAFVGMYLALIIWWVYFDLVAVSKPKDNLLSVWAWSMLHVPIAFSICLMASSIISIMHLDNISLSLAYITKDFMVPITGLYICVFLITRTLEKTKYHFYARKRSRFSLFVSIGFLILLYFIPISNDLKLIFNLVVISFPVFTEIISQVHFNEFQDRNEDKKTTDSSVV